MKKIAQTYDKAWKHILASAVSFALSYAAASWAIDSGRLLAYFLAIVLTILGIKHLISAFRKANAK